MNAGRPIRIDKVCLDHPPGGDWERLDPLARKPVQVLAVRGDAVVQAQAAVMEFQQLAALSPDWDWSRCAVISREWRYLAPVRTCFEHDGIPVQSANEAVPNFWRLRETKRYCRRCAQMAPRPASRARGLARLPAPRTVDRVAGRRESTSTAPRPAGPTRRSSTLEEWLAD